MARRILSLLLAVMLIFSAVPVFAHAENTDPAELSEDQFQSYVAAVSTAPKSDALESADYSKAECAMSNFGISMTETEPNYNTALADPVYNDYTVSGSLSSYDLDYYRFVLSSTSTVNILSAASNSSTVFALCDSNDDIICVSSFDRYSNGYVCQYITKSLSAGTYYLCFINTNNYTDSYAFYIACSSSHTHSYGSYISDNNGTPNSEGTKSATCSTCGNKNTVADTNVHLPNVKMLAPVGHVTGNILYWEAVENATLYQVFRLNNGSWELLANTRGTAYKDVDAPVGVKSYYKVRVRQDSLMSSMAIPSVSVTRPAPVTKLDNVTITSINAHTTGNILYWNAVPNATLYQVYRLKGSSWELLKNTGGTAYKDETAPAGVRSYYKIVARNGDIASNIAATVSASAIRPAVLTSLSNVTITSINGHKSGNIIYWNAVPNATLYQVYCLKGSSWELLKNTSGTAYKDETAACGVRSYYKIVARNGNIASNISTTTSNSAVRAHDYSITDSASGTSGGYTTYTCKNCGYSYQDSYTDDKTSSSTGSTDTTAIYNTLMSFKSKYPEGTPFDNSVSYTWSTDNCLYIDSGCAAFVSELSHAAFGVKDFVTMYNITIADVRVGDILRINNGSHSVIILEVYSDYVVIAEANYNGTVHWGRTLTAAQVANATYMISRYPDRLG